MSLIVHMAWYKMSMLLLLLALMTVTFTNTTIIYHGMPYKTRLLLALLCFENNHWLHVFLILFYAGSSTVITSAALYLVNLGISQTWSVWIYTWTTSLVQYLFHWGTYWSCGSCKISLHWSIDYHFYSL